MHRSLQWVFLSIASLSTLPAQADALSAAAAGPRPPNVVIVYADDLGYGDIGCYGAKGLRTPNIDRLAGEGVRFTDFYVAQAVCTASRAALLTGCYPNRIGLMGALGPKSKVGIHDGELTLAEMFKSRGYATAIFGKWHLGDDPKFLPTRHGFDEYFGLPYSNDMWPRHPENPRAYPDLPLIENDRVVQINPDQRMLTTWYTQRAVKFIEKSKDRPFFLYVPHNMPHVPLFVSDKHKGSSQRGLYGDVIQEIDWSVGQVLDAIKTHGLDEQTLVMFASDNGPWLLYGDHAGSAGPLREGKATSFDGGVRVPCVMRWPGKIPRGTVCREVAATIDVLPTLAKLAGADLPGLLEGRIIDGKDVWPLISGQEGAKSPHDAYFIYWGRHLQAVRAGKWKLHFPHSYPKPDPPGGDAKPGKYAQKQIGLALFDMEADPGESTDVADKHPEVVERLKGLAEKAREDLGDSETKQEGKGVRQPGRIQVAAPAGQKPNALFIAVDDLNDWVGCLDGHPQVKTPNIDRLAKRGTLFTPRLLRRARLQPVARGAAHRRPPARVRRVPQHAALAAGDAGRGHAAAALHEARLPRRRSGQDLPRRVRRAGVVERVRQRRRRRCQPPPEGARRRGRHYLGRARRPRRADARPPHRLVDDRPPRAEARQAAVPRVRPAQAAHAVARAAEVLRHVPAGADQAAGRAG
jgi:arylsulfatase A-like enzyme